MSTTVPTERSRWWLRIGRREGGSRIDAIVIHVNGDLTQEELDLLFTNPPEPDPGPIFILGDVNFDGVVDFFDISPFISRLSDGEYFEEADMNQDGVVNFLDISPFISLLSS